MDENILFKIFYSVFLSTGLFSIACFTVIIALCEVKKKKSQVQHPATLKSTSSIKTTQILPKSEKKPSPSSKNEIEESQKPTTKAAATEDGKKSPGKTNNKNQGVEEGLQRQSSSKEDDENNNNILNKNKKKKKEEEIDAKDCKTAEQDVEEKKSEESPEFLPPKDKAQVLGNFDEIIKDASPEEGQQQEKDKKKKSASKHRHHRKRREGGDQGGDQQKREHHHRRRLKYRYNNEEDTLCETNGREMPTVDFSEEFYELQLRKKISKSK